MQKFQAKGGLATSDITLTPPDKTPLIDILDKSNKSQFHIEMESGAAGFYGRRTEDLRSLNTPKIDGKIVHATYYNKTLIVFETSASKTGRMYISKDFGTTYTEVDYPAGYGPSNIFETIYDAANDTMYVFAYDFVLTITNNFSVVKAASVSGGNNGPILHNGVVYFCGGYPNYYIMKMVDASAVRVATPAAAPLGGLASKGGVLYYLANSGLYYSTNNGSSFTKWTGTLPNGVTGMASDGTNFFFGGTTNYPDFDLWMGTDLNKLTVVKHIPGDGTFVYAGAIKINGSVITTNAFKSKMVLISTDAGATWDEMPIDPAMGPATFAFKVEELALVYGSPSSNVVKNLGSAIVGPILQIKADGIYTAFPQPSSGNSFARKDYVDSLISSSTGDQQTAILAETDKRYMTANGGTLTGTLRIDTANDCQIFLNDQDDGPSYITFGRKDVQNHHIRNSTNGNLEILSKKPDNTLVTPFYANTTGVFTSLAQNTAANALTRKDFVDTSIATAKTQIKTQSDADYVRVAGDKMVGNLDIDSKAAIRFVEGTTPQFTIVKTLTDGLPSISCTSAVISSSSTSPLALPNGTAAKSIQYGNGMAVVVGVGYLATSADGGRNWTRNTTAPFISTAFNPTVVSFAGGMWFIGTAGGMYYSQDAITWKAATVPNTVDQNFQVASYKNEFICGTTNGIIRSTNGETWTGQVVAASTPSKQYFATAASGTNVVIAGTGGTCYTSPNATAWTQKTVFSSSDMMRIVFKVDKFVAFASSHAMYISADGNTWTAINAPATTSGETYGIDYSGTCLVAGYGPKGTYFVSYDQGKTWKSYSVDDDGYITDVTIVDDNTSLLCTSSGKVHIARYGNPAVVPLRVNADGAFTDCQQSSLANAFTRRDYVDSTFLKKAGDSISGDVIVSNGNKLRVNEIATTWENWDAVGNSTIIKMGTYDINKGGDLVEIRTAGAGAPNRNSGFDIRTTKNISNTPLFVGTNEVFHRGNIPTPSDVGALPGVATESAKPPLTATKGWHVIARVTLPQSASTARIDITGGTGFNVGQPNQLAMSTIIIRTGNNNPKGIDVVVYEMGGTASIIKSIASKNVSGNDYDIYVEANNYGNAGLIYRGQTSGGNLSFTEPAVNLGATKPDGLVDGWIYQTYNTNYVPSATDVAAVPLAGGTMTGTLGVPNLKLGIGGKINLASTGYSAGANIYAIDGGQYGAQLFISSGGNTIVGSGESADNLKDLPVGEENLYLTSDGTITLISGANDWTKRVTTTIANNGRITSPNGITIENTGGHIDLIGTNQENKNWRMEAHGGSFKVTETGVATRVTVKAGGGMDVSGTITNNGEISSKSSNSYRMSDGVIGTFWRKDGDTLYLMRTEDNKAADGTWTAARPFAMNLASCQVVLGEGVVVKKGLEVQAGPLVLTTNYLKGANDAIIMRDHGNGNVTLSGSLNSSGVAGDLYLGYTASAPAGTAGYNTRSVRLESPMNWKGGTTIVDDVGGLNSEILVGPIRTDKDAANIYSTVLGGTDAVNRGRTILAAGKSGAQVLANTLTASKQIHIAAEQTDGVFIHTGLSAWGTGTHKKIKFQDGNITLNDGTESGSLYFGANTYATLSGGSLYLAANTASTGRVVIEGQKDPVARVAGKDNEIFHAGNREFYANSLNRPAGLEDGKYYPILITNAWNNQRLYISTRQSGGGDAMNNCSFDGVVRSSGWSDGISYVDGVFTTYQTNERAIHSIWGNSEDQGVVVIYVEARAFPLIVKADYSCAVSCTGKDATSGTAIYKAGLTSAELDAGTGNTKSKILVNFNRGLQVARYLNNNLVYHEGFKPASGDMNAVAITGDTMTGQLINTVDSIMPFVAEKGGYHAMFGNSVVPGEFLFGGKAKADTDYQHYIRLGNKKFQYFEAGKTSDVYHTNNKPSADDVGALSSSGGTLTGQLKINNLGWPTKIDELNGTKSAILIPTAQFPGGNATYYQEFIHGSCRRDQNGYTQHGSMGIKRSTGSNWQQLYLATGGNDGYPTKEWLFDYTGTFTSPGDIYVGANKVYHPGNKPSLVDLGAAATNHTHTAAEVNAAAIDHTHAPADIGAAAASHTHTASQVGAAAINHTHNPVDIGASRARGAFGTGATSNITTAEFITIITGEGAFASRHWVARGSWNYAGNKTITDTEVGNIHLAGSTIEVISESANQYTITIKCPTTTSGGGTVNTEFVYVNNGSTYKPGWRRIYSTADKPTLSELGAQGTSDVRSNSMNNTQTVIPTTEVGDMNSQIAGYYSLYNGTKVANSPYQGLFYCETKSIYSTGALLQTAWPYDGNGSVYHRNYSMNTNSWTAWRKFYDSGSKPTPNEIGAAPGGFGLGEYCANVPGGDVNTGLRTASGYYNGTSLKNRPAWPNTTHTWDYIFNAAHGNAAGYNAMIAMDFAGRGMAFKTVENGTDKGWNYVYHSGYKPSPADIGAAPANLGTLSTTQFQMNGGSNITFEQHVPGKFANMIWTDATNGDFNFTISNGGHGEVTRMLKMSRADKQLWSPYSLSLQGSVYSNGNMVINNNNPTMWFQDTDNRSAAIHNNSNLLYVLRGNGNNATAWDNGPNGRHPMTLNLESGDVVFSGNVVAYSDARLKKDVNNIEFALDKVLKLRPVTYKRIGEDTDRVECGFIAQELQEVIPEVVLEQPDDDKTLTVDYARMVAYMAGAIKELNAKIEQLEAKLKERE